MTERLLKEERTLNKRTGGDAGESRRLRPTTLKSGKKIKEVK
jgi:hypothetical protein